MKSSSSPMRRPSDATPPRPRSHKLLRDVKENLEPPPPPPECSPFRSPIVKKRSPLPPRPPPSNPLKRKLHLDIPQDTASPAPPPPDSEVKVILRVRPPSEGEEEEEGITQKISPNSVSFLDYTFTFDSIADVGSTQEDIYELVGLPLVENCLAGFNSSIFAYGQTGSGKTYTMWGPSTALSEDCMSNAERGLMPRVFEQLFNRIKEEQIKHSGKQLIYQCRCSFLEIYNEQITDLLDPSQKNLQIREDVRTGVYVENLREDFVSSIQDVMKLLIKGLENRRVGATSMNAESSRSHCVFTCIVESRSKCLSDGLSSLRTSRINLVDLAGSERQKLTAAAGERLKEAGNINRSLSQLGNLINILGEISQSGKQRHIPYRDSKLTFLLQDSLGGNAKLSMICAVSPSPSCRAETLGTLRFAQRAKDIKNKAVVNEVTQDDVNVLREQIRQLKDELVRMKSGSTDNNGSFSTGWNARRSLNILRQSLSRPMNITAADDDNDEEMEIDDDAVERPYFKGGGTARSMEVSIPPAEELLYPVPLDCGDAISLQRYQSNCNDSADICKEVCEAGTTGRDHLDLNAGSKNEDDILPDVKMLTARKTLGEISPNVLRISNSEGIPCHSIIPCQPPTLDVATASVSPRVSSSRKSLRTSFLRPASREVEVSESSVSTVLDPSSALTLACNPLKSSSRRSESCLVPTEHLAASLRHGLQIFDLHQQKSPLRRSPFRLSVKPSESKSSLLPAMVAKVDFGMQTISQELDVSEDTSPYICSYCKNKAPPIEYKDVSVDTELQLVPLGSAYSAEKSAKQVPKAVEKVLAGAIRREMALEDHCAKQAAEIAHLRRLVQQYKHERECNVIIEQTREDKISRLEGLMDGIVPIEHYMDGEFLSLANEHKILQEKYENHPEVLRVNTELKRVQDELQTYKNFCDLGERDILMEEIVDLRRQLQYYIDLPSAQSRSRSPMLQLTHTNESVTVSPEEATETENVEECAKKKLEDERRLWTETESRWISLSEELRLELESTRSVAERQKAELDSERKCMEELKEALQTAMNSHARILEQYAELEEKHIQLLARHRKIRDGIVDVKKAAAKAGIRGAESRFIDCLAAEISTLKEEREKERRYWRDENKALQCQLRDTAEAVQAAGELLVRLKEAEEAAERAQKQASVAEKEAGNAKQKFENLKKKHEAEISFLNQCLTESRLPSEALKPMECDTGEAKYDEVESLADQQWRTEFDPFLQGDCNDFSRGAEHHSWFSGYDRCNI